MSRGGAAVERSDEGAKRHGRSRSRAADCGSRGRPAAERPRPPLPSGPAAHVRLAAKHRRSVHRRQPAAIASHRRSAHCGCVARSADAAYRRSAERRPLPLRAAAARQTSTRRSAPVARFPPPETVPSRVPSRGDGRRARAGGPAGGRGDRRPRRCRRAASRSTPSSSGSARTRRSCAWCRSPSDEHVALVDPLEGAPLEPIAELVADPDVEVVMHAPAGDLLAFGLRYGVSRRASSTRSCSRASSG